MANHKSALKRIRQNARRQVRNRDVRTEVRSTVKHARLALVAGDAEPAATAARDAEIKLARAARKGVLHPRNAARRASRLARQAAKLKS